MKRYTVKNTDGTISITDDVDLQEALHRFAAFEDVLEELAAEQAEIPTELVRLRFEGKEKTIHYKELFGQKLMNNHTILLFERHGIKTE